MFHWLLVAPQSLKNVLPVAGCFSNKEMRTFCRIRPHQFTSETINTSLWWRKTKPASVNYFAVVVLATNKTCGGFPLTSFCLFCVVENHGLKGTFQHSVKENPFHVSTNISAFLPVSDQRPMSLPTVVASAISFYRVFRWSLLDVLLLLPRW